MSLGSTSAKKSQASHVDTDDGGLLRPHPAGSLQESAVTPKGDDVIHLEVITVEHARCLYFQVLALGQEVIERPVEEHLCLPFVEKGQHF